MTERNKGGRKPNPDGKARKAYQVYCTSEYAEVCRMIVKLPEEKILHIKTWIEKGASVGGKK